MISGVSNGLMRIFMFNRLLVWCNCVCLYKFCGKVCVIMLLMSVFIFCIVLVVINIVKLEVVIVISVVSIKMDILMRIIGWWFMWLEIGL